MRLDAVLCMQKELVEHMLASVSTDKYSKLSVISNYNAIKYITNWIK